MRATWKFELRKHYLCETREQVLKKMSKYQNMKIANTAALNGEDDVVVTYWFEKIMDISTFILYYQFEIFCRS